MTISTLRLKTELTSPTEAIILKLLDASFLTCGVPKTAEVETAAALDRKSPGIDGTRLVSGVGFRHMLCWLTRRSELSTYTSVSFFVDEFPPIK